MDKLLEALKKTSLSAQQVSEVQKAVEGMIAEAVKQIDAKRKTEYDAKVQEAYEKVASELEAVEEKAQEGYKQAYAIINDQQLRIEQITREYENKMDEGYQQAWEMLQAEQAKNNTLALEVHKDYDGRFQQMRDFMVEKLDEFLQMQQASIYDEARRDVLNDPKMVEHRVALEKMSEIMNDYFTVEGVANNNSKKFSETLSELEELRGRLQVVEHRNVRLSTKNDQLTEAVRQKDQLLSETQQHVTEVERKNRKNSAGIASGRGQRVITENRGSLIPEFSNANTSRDDELVEQSDVLNDLLVLSGVHDIMESEAKSKRDRK